MYPFYEKLVKWSKDRRPGSSNVCIHKGLVPAVGGAAVPASARLLPRRRRRQGGEGLAAAQFHHLPLGVPLGRPGGTAEHAWEQLQRTGRIEWVTDLADIPRSSA